MAENPGHSVPRLSAGPYAVNAAYTFFDRATPAYSKGTGNW
jgi:hypothetical protein